MKPICSVCLAAGLTILLPAPGSAATVDIIDTQPTVSSGGWTLSSDQWLAAEFNLDADYNITDLAGWVRSDGRTGQHFTITVYGDGGNVPDTNDLLYSNQVTVTGNESSSWEGYHIGFGQGLPLTAGTYWLGFEVRPSNYLDPYSGLMPGTATDPLQNYAANFTGSWGATVPLALGIRISGNLSAVPLPGAVWLFGSALAGLGLIRRKPVLG